VDAILDVADIARRSLYQRLGGKDQLVAGVRWRRRWPHAPRQRPTGAMWRYADAVEPASQRRERDVRRLRWYFPGFCQMLGNVGEFAVEPLGCAPQQVEGITGREVLAFHQDALGLSDDVACAQSSM
jgi:hypothetical protein